MNTLSPEITKSILGDPAKYLAIKNQWRTLMASPRKHELTATHHLLYCALMGKDWRRGFTPPTNPVKLENGAYEGWILFQCLMQLHYPQEEAALLAPFEYQLRPAMLKRLRKFMPKPNPYHFNVAGFADGKFPFDAYIDLDETAGS